MKLIRVLTFGCVVLALFLFIRLWAGAGSYPEIWDLYKQIKAQEQENEQLKARNDQMQADLKNLGEDPETIEEHARNELGLIKQGETFYQVLLKDEAKQPEIPLAPTPAIKQTTPAPNPTIAESEANQANIEAPPPADTGTTTVIQPQSVTPEAKPNAQ